jgi:cysteine sulfinate desulfinase/cysteine desulfurase-like protein
MLALGYEEELAKQFIRFSFDPATSEDDAIQAAVVLSGILKTHLEHVKA